jgi:hypothetical protein
VRTLPDDDWGVQINRLVDSQLDPARQFEDLRPNPDALDSPLLEE